MAQITLGAEPSFDENAKDPNIFYYVTVLELPEGESPDDHQAYVEVCQFRHDKLESALTDINQRYQLWEWTDRTAEQESNSGCGSCSAH